VTKKRKRYTDQFKQEAVRAVETRGNRTVAEVAESLGVPEHMLHAWKSKAKADGSASDRKESAEEELRRLRRENADLKKDRDVLVKSIAVVCHERGVRKHAANYNRDGGRPSEIGLQGQISNRSELRR